MPLGKKTDYSRATDALVVAFSEAGFNEIR